MYLFGIDVETTGLDPYKNRVIEIGAVLWDTELSLPVMLYSELVREEENLIIPEEITELTGITQGMLASFGLEPQQGLFAKLNWMMEQADYYVAHNAAFDRGFMNAFYSRWGLAMPEKPWICTVNDVAYPKRFRSRALVALAGEHGFANPFAHRAVTDVLTMFRVLSHYDINEVVKASVAVKLEVTALVSFDDRQKAKDLGFKWNNEHKKWKKIMRQDQFDPKEFPFAVEFEEV